MFQGRLSFTSEYSRALLSSVSVLGVCAGLATPTTVFAQDGAAADEMVSLESIVVTANRREEGLQDVPLAITALSSDTLDAANVDTLDDLQTLTPGLNLGGRSTVRPQLSIRGIGTEQFTNAIDSPIGVFVDDVSIARFSSFFAPFTDIERVEILRGPQGTLYGRNTIAGAINIVTKKPTDELEGSFEVGIGNYDERSLRGSVSGPLIEDKVRFRFAGFSTERDGYLKNVITGGTANGENTTGFYGKLFFTPNDMWSIDLSADYGETDAPGEASEPSDRNQAGLFLRPGTVYGVGPTADPFTYASDIDPRITREQWGGSVRAERFGDGVNFISISAFRDSFTSTFHDNDGTELESFLQIEAEDSTVYSQELRLLSNPGGPGTFGSRFEWLLGAYYFHEDTSRKSEFPLGIDSLFTSLAETSANPISVAAAADGLVTERVRNSIETDSYAAFGRGTLDITDRLALTVGLRYSVDEKTADISVRTETPDVPIATADFDTVGIGDTWSSFDQQVTLDYNVTDNILAYATYSTGYKSGGFQPVPFSQLQSTVVVRPEQLKMYEGGIKASLFDDRATVNLAVFDYEYEDLHVTQVLSFPGGSLAAAISNAPGVSNTGFEVEALALLTESLQVGLGYTYLEAEYVDFPASVAGSGTVNVGGQRLPRAPEHQVTARFDYTKNLTPDLRFDLSGNYMWQDDTFLLTGGDLLLPAVQPSPNVEPAYSIGNLKATITNEDTGIYFGAYVRNVADTTYRTGINVIGSTPSVDYWGAPRTYGIQIGWRG